MVRAVHPPPGWFTRRKLLLATRILCLDLLLANSLAPSWQTPDTLGELPTHSWRVPKRIDSMYGLNIS
ncbi:hypothetical protein BHM03_00011344 [Ensete ventricosum]|nr:hypothetical protein BHM03_00011344 [Ensete ventricosum]